MYGALDQNRTGGLIFTKNVRYQLRHKSIKCLECGVQSRESLTALLRAFTEPNTFYYEMIPSTLPSISTNFKLPLNFNAPFVCGLSGVSFVVNPIPGSTVKCHT